MTEKQKEIERIGIDLLTKRGLSFEVEAFSAKRKKGFIGYFSKRTREKEILRYNIQEPTLAVLDRLAAEQIDLVIDDTVLSGDNAISEARKLTKDHSRRLARIVAIAVLGEEYEEATISGSRIAYKRRDDKLDFLTDLFFHNVKPSDLMQIVLIINTISNLGDFCNSIRLLSGERTTMPHLVEEKAG